MRSPGLMMVKVFAFLRIREASALDHTSLPLFAGWRKRFQPVPERSGDASRLARSATNCRPKRFSGPSGATELGEHLGRAQPALSRGAPLLSAHAAPHPDRPLTEVERGLQAFGPDFTRAAVGQRLVERCAPRG
jgi:hypothetical protein